MGMDEYIEKGAAIAVIMSEPSDAHYPHWYADKIKSIPAADVAPVRHGRWNDWEVFWKECSCCRYRTQKINAREYFFCPKCGAKMDERDE